MPLPAKWLQAIEAGAISPLSIEADLAELCRSEGLARDNDDQAVTLFKSVGMALEDLAAAEFVWQRRQ